MTKRRHILLATLGCAAALLGAAGCGSKKKGTQVPRASVAALETQLASIERRVKAGACRDVTDGSDPNTAVVRSELDALPSSVDKDVRSALEQSFQNLFSLVQDQCKQANTSTTPTTTQPTVTQTTPTTTQTVPTETTTTGTTTTPKPGNKPKKPKGTAKKGGGEGVDGGNGGGGTSAPGGG